MEEVNKRNSLMKLVQIGFLELSFGPKNPLGRGTSKIKVFAKQSKQIKGKVDFSVLRGSKIGVCGGVRGSKMLLGCSAGVMLCFCSIFDRGF